MNFLAPKLARALLKFSLGTLDPELLASRVLLVNFRVANLECHSTSAVFVECHVTANQHITNFHFLEGELSTSFIGEDLSSPSFWDATHKFPTHVQCQS